MANSSWFNTSNEYIKYRIELTVNSQNQVSNYSNITVKVRFYRTNTGFETYGSGTCYCVIDGTSYSQSVTSSQKITHDGIYLFEKTLNVAHTNDGSKSLTISASLDHTRFTASSNSWTTSLTTIPRASSFTISSTRVLGVQNTVTITKADPEFSHTLIWSCVTGSGLIAEKTSATYATWTPELWAAAQNPDGTSVTITITCTTFNGDVQLGTTSESYIFSIPDSVKPSISIGVTDTSGCYTAYGIYVQGKSALRINITPTLAYGSAIASYSITVDGRTYSTQTCTTGVLSSTGTVQISASVTDGRGRTATASRSISVIAYSPPVISRLQVTRCNSNGVDNFEGNYGRIEFECVLASMNNQNTASYSVTYTPTSGSGGGSSNLTTFNNNFHPNSSIIVPMDSSHAYDVVFTATDSFTSVTLRTTASTGFALINWGSDGRSIAFGKVAERGDEADFGLPVRLSGGLHYVPLQDGDDWNNITAPGYYVADKSSHSYTNCPFTSGKLLLRVYAIGLSGDLIQVCTSPYANYNQSIRRVRNSDTWSNWYYDVPYGTIPALKGGTGRTSNTSGSILLGNGTSAMTELLGTGAIYATASGSPQFGALPVSCGGTGSTTAEDARSALGITLSGLGISVGSRCLTIGDLKIAFGSMGASSMSGAATKTVDLSSFGFSSAPKIVANPVCSSTAAAGYALSAYVMSVSASSATVRVSSNYTNSLSVGLVWIAIGS